LQPDCKGIELPGHARINEACRRSVDGAR